MRKAPRRAAYSLIELLVVLTIIAALFTLAMGAFLSWGRATSVRTAAYNCTTTLDLARQWAITHRTPATVELFNDGPQGIYTIRGVFGDVDTPRLVCPTNRLPNAVLFSSPTPPTLIFSPDGSADWEPQQEVTCTIIMREFGPPTEVALASTITVSRLTGYIGDAE